MAPEYQNRIMSKMIFIDGNDGTGKTSICRMFQELRPDLEVKDRCILTGCTDIFDDDLPKQLDDGIYIILGATVDESRKRIEARGGETDKYDSYEALFKYHNRYRRLAIRYNTFWIDTTGRTLEDVYNDIIDLISDRVDKKLFRLPNPDSYKDIFDTLPVIKFGDVEIRALDEKYDLVRYNKMQIGPICLSTDQIHQMLRYILYLFDIENIHHTHLYIGDNLVLKVRGECIMLNSTLKNHLQKIDFSVITDVNLNIDYLDHICTQLVCEGIFVEAEWIRNPDCFGDQTQEYIDLFNNWDSIVSVFGSYIKSIHPKLKYEL